MKVGLLILHTCLFLFYNSTIAQTLVSHKQTLELMDASFVLGLSAENETQIQQAIREGIDELKRIEKFTSSQVEHSLIRTINQNAGIRPTKVNQELFDLIARSKKISKLTRGAFDITVASADSLWNFGSAPKTFPNALQIQKAQRNIDWKSIILNVKTQTVFLKKKNMQIDISSLAKGYGFDQAIQKMKKIEGVGSLFIKEGNNLMAWGVMSETPEGRIVTYSKPKDSTQLLGYLEANNNSIVTLGNFKDTILYKNVLYTPVIDPRTAFPISGIKSVTIVCPDPEVAYVLAEAVFVLGQLEGLSLVDQLVGVECMILTDKNKVLGSKRLKLRH